MPFLAALGPILAGAAGTSAAATTGAWAAIGAGAAAGASIYGAHKTSDAAETAARIQGDAATHAADLTKQGTDAALKFQQDEAARAQRNFELTQRANYDQWSAQQRRLSALGVMAGLAPRDIPGYVGTTGSPGTAGGPPSGLDISTAGPDFVKGLLTQGVTPTDAIKQFNQKFGRKTGTEAVFDAKTGTIGFPSGDGSAYGGYLVNGNQGWGFVAHNAPEGGASAPGTLGRALSPLAAATVTPSSSTPAPGSLGMLAGMPVGLMTPDITPIRPAYQPGALGSYFA